jgi:hypothetical protein
MPRAFGRRERRTRLAPGVVAAAALAGWVFAVPALFIHWGGWPLDGMPGWAALRSLPAPGSVDQIVGAAASILLWGLWGQLAWGVVTELVAWFRNSALDAASPPRTRADRPANDDRDFIRRFAALLVHAVVPHPRRDRHGGARPHRGDRSNVTRRAGRRPHRARDDSRKADPAPQPRRARRASATTPEPESDPPLEPEPTPTRPEPVSPAATTAEPAATAERPAEPLIDHPRHDGGRGDEPDERQRIDEPVRVRRLAALLAEVDILVRVLGPVEAVRPGAGRAGGRPRVVPVRQKALEALVYLASHDTGVTRHELGQVLFPDDESSERALYNAVHQVHKVVGHHPPPDIAGRHLLLPESITTDHGLLGDLHAQAHRCPHGRLRAALLDEALSLVRGQPFSGVTRSYAWAAPHRRQMADDVAAVAAELAELYRDAGDDAGAEDAARRGLLAAPDDPDLQRLAGPMPAGAAAENAT